MIDDFGITFKNTISGSGSREEEAKRVESELKSAEIKQARAKKNIKKGKTKSKEIVFYIINYLNFKANNCYFF
ncbi:MAG: hypothetical protein NWQ31_01485 [Polaribacter sp.]|nr:hypothetical protein [Polaribacter sp.]